MGALCDESFPRVEPCSNARCSVIGDMVASWSFVSKRRVGRAGVRKGTTYAGMGRGGEGYGGIAYSE